LFPTLYPPLTSAGWQRAGNKTPAQLIEKGEQMSYPSIKNVNPDTLTEREREQALLAAFRIDLPLGMAAIERDVAEVKSNGGRKLVPEDPNSPLGKQIIRLLGTDVARGILERHHGVAFGLYNCCGRVVAPSHDTLQMTTTEQIKLQNGVIASADC
jgi:hypothetical protein